MLPNERKVNDDKATTLYSAMVQEAQGLYSQLLTACLAFLGGSVSVLYRLMPPTGETRFILVLSWVFFTVTIALLVWIRWQNVEAHRHVLESLKVDGQDGGGRENADGQHVHEAKKEYEKAKATAHLTRRLTKVMLFFLCAAFGSLTAYGARSLHTTH